MKVKDLIKELQNFNQEAELEFVISEVDGDNYGLEQLSFNPYDEHLMKTSNTKATNVEFILSLGEELIIKHIRRRQWKIA